MSGSTGSSNQVKRPTREEALDLLRSTMAEARPAYGDLMYAAELVVFTHGVEGTPPTEPEAKLGREGWDVLAVQAARNLWPTFQESGGTLHAFERVVGAALLAVAQDVTEQIAERVDREMAEEAAGMIAELWEDP